MVAGGLLPPLIDGFLKQRPGLRLSVVQAGAEEIGARVLRGELDLGITAHWRTPDGLVTHVLEVQAMAACVAPRRRSRRCGSAGGLLDQRLIMFPRGYYQRSRIEDAAGAAAASARYRGRGGIAAAGRRAGAPGHGVATLLAAAATDLPGIATLALPREATVPVAVCPALTPRPTPRSRPSTPICCATPAAGRARPCQFPSPRQARGRGTTRYPRPTNGILVAITVMNSMLASSGRLAM